MGQRDNGRLVMQNNWKIITALLQTLYYSSVLQEPLFSPTLEWQPHQLALPLRVCELHVKTEFVQKCSCKLCNTNVASVSSPFTCSDRLVSFQISLIGGGPPLTVTRAQKLKETAPVATSTMSVVRFTSCSCNWVFASEKKKKKIWFSLRSGRKQIRKEIIICKYVMLRPPNLFLGPMVLE